MYFICLLGALFFTLNSFSSDSGIHEALQKYQENKAREIKAEEDRKSGLWLIMSSVDKVENPTGSQVQNVKDAFLEKIKGGWSPALVRFAVDYLSHPSSTVRTMGIDLVARIPKNRFTPTVKAALLKAALENPTAAARRFVMCNLILNPKNLYRSDFEYGFITVKNAPLHDRREAMAVTADMKEVIEALYYDTDEATAQCARYAYNLYFAGNYNVYSSGSQNRPVFHFVWNR